MQALVRIGSIIFLCVLCLILAIRGRPATYHELDALLLPPPGCPSPCFLGIRNNRTTAEDAAAILEAHLWVEEVETDILRGYIRWDWTAEAPIENPHTYPNEILLIPETFRVSSVTLRLNTSTGGLWYYLTSTTDKDGLPLSSYIRVAANHCLRDADAFYQNIPAHINYSNQYSASKGLFAPLQRRCTF